MEDLFAKCGFNCGRCPAYKDNATTDEAREWGSDGWKKYYGFQIRYDRMYCDGCQTPDEAKPVLLDTRCPIRKCAVMNGVETCAHCSEYQTCMHELRVFNPNIDRGAIEARLGAPVPEEDYQGFIAPFEFLKHLEQIRSSLDPKDIKVVEVQVARSKTVDFPEDLMSKEDAAAFKALHRLLTQVASISGGTYAQKKQLEKRKLYLFKLLWVFGLYGESEQEGGAHLVLDSETYSAQKLTGDTGKIDLYLGTLAELGAQCEYAPLPEEKQDKKGWRTPMGWLRHVGWFMRMGFDENAGGPSGLKALKSYVAKLEKKHGKRAFRYFKSVDMHAMVD